MTSWKNNNTLGYKRLAEETLDSITKPGKIVTRDRHRKLTWHPYPEEKPTEAGSYLLTIKGPRDSEPWIDDEYFYDPEDNGIFYEYGWERYDDVTAWAQYPAPYKGDGSSSDELWIPCSDRLPEEGAKCFVTCDDGRTRFVKEDEFVDKDMLFETDLLGGGKIVAWMPYPEPYMGEE